VTTSEEARPALVLPEYGPTAPELIRRRFAPRAQRAIAVGAVVVVVLLALLIATRSGDGLTTLEHRSAPVFTLLHPAGPVRRVAPHPGELVRLRSGRGALQMTVSVRKLTLPPYSGSVSGFLPVYADRHVQALAAELPGFQARTDGKARVNDAPGYQVKYRAATQQRRLTGIDILIVPEDGSRDGVLLRYRQTNPPRALNAADKDLVKATRKAFRSFRFGLDRP
jgi:hypothetical protein